MHTCLVAAALIVVSSSAERLSRFRPIFDDENFGLDEGHSLVQTDMALSLLPVEDGGSCFQNCTSPKSVSFERFQVTGATQPFMIVTATPDAEDLEVSRRFHKDFLAAVLIMSSVFPWWAQTACHSHQQAHSAAKFLPSGVALRVLCVFCLWCDHYWLNAAQSHFLHVVFCFLGAAFDVIHYHDNSADDVWIRLSEFVPPSYSRLYPFYTFYVIASYLLFFSAPSNAHDGLLLHWAGKLFAWMLSVVFGCYLVVPALTHPPPHLDTNALAMFCSGCVAMVVLPRTLAAPIQNPWAWTDVSAAGLHSQQSGQVYELFLARKSLLTGMCSFFLGLVLTRTTVILGSASESASRKGSSSISRVSPPPPGGQAHDGELWRRFEEEARRDIHQSLSVSAPFCSSSH